MRLERQEVPCPIRPALRGVLEAHMREYGTGGGIGEALPAAAVRRLAADDGAQTLGFAWLSESGGCYRPQGDYVVIAVYADVRSGGVGRAALRLVEEAARADLRLHELFAQVNNTDPRTGLRVRRWLLGEGYEPVREDRVELARYNELPDDEYVARNAWPLVFRKPLR